MISLILSGTPLMTIPTTNNKEKSDAIERYSKGQFFSNTVYLERGMPYFAFVDTNAVLVRKIDKA